MRLETLINESDKHLSHKMGNQAHWLHSVLPPLPCSASVQTRPKGHPYELPRYKYDLSRKSFVLRSLYNFVWFYVFWLYDFICAIHIRLIGVQLKRYILSARLTYFCSYHILSLCRLIHRHHPELAHSFKTYALSQIFPITDFLLASALTPRTLWLDPFFWASRFLLRPRERLRSIAMSMSVCLSACPREYLRNRTRDLYQIFCACCLYPWLGRPQACWR